MSARVRTMNPPDRAHHFVVGDIHGCGEEFLSLLDTIDARHSVADTHVVLLGDHLAKGPRPDLVIRAILDRRRLGGRVTLLCGNHELRFLEALERCGAGAADDDLSRPLRRTLSLLDSKGLIEIAGTLMREAAETTQLTVIGPGGLWSVLHGGIDPELGLDGTSDHAKIHMKAGRKQIDWWDRYDGADGLIICGHKPLPEPVVVRDERDRPIAINLDTGCIYGGHLSAWHVEAGRLLQIRSVQPIDRSRLEFAVSPTVAPSEAPSAWDVPGRTFAS